MAVFDPQASLHQVGRRSLQPGWPDLLALILDVDYVGYVGYVGCVGHRWVLGCVAATSTTSVSATCQRLCAGSGLIRGAPQLYDRKRPALMLTDLQVDQALVGRAGLAKGHVRPEPSRPAGAVGGPESEAQ